MEVFYDLFVFENEYLNESLDKFLCEYADILRHTGLIVYTIFFMLLC